MIVMLALDKPRRVFGAVMAFSISVLFLSGLLSFKQPNSSIPQHVWNLRPPSDLEPATDTLHREIRSVALPFGRKDNSANFSFVRRASEPGNYGTAVIPDYTTIVAQYLYSPQAMLRDRRNPPPPPDSDVPNLVPPLHHLADVMWLSWIEVAGDNPGRLRYIGHDFITNPETGGIISLIFRASVGVDAVSWPGLEFDIDTFEAKALLGTPNSISVVWIMVNNAATLGRRRPKVRIWHGDGVDLMLWDLAPA
ncbi:MAG: hypothetical protein Q9218_005775 [Villophora microphyllina]